MITPFPELMFRLQPLPVRETGDLTNGMIFWAVRQISAETLGLRLVQITIRAQKRIDGSPTIQLQSIDRAAIIHGDSGVDYS